jgi:hypothetical protein
MLLAFIKIQMKGVQMHKNKKDMVARFMGSQEDTYLGRGKVYRLHVKYNRYGTLEMILARIFGVRLPLVDVWTTSKFGELDNHTQYFDLEAFDDDWKIERNKYMRNVRKGI